MKNKKIFALLLIAFGSALLQALYAGNGASCTSNTSTKTNVVTFNPTHNTDGTPDHPRTSPNAPYASVASFNQYVIILYRSYRPKPNGLLFNDEDDAFNEESALTTAPPTPRENRASLMTPETLRR